MLELPPSAMRFMNENDEKFMRIACENTNQLQLAGLRSDHTLLDVGCGYGRLVYGLEKELEFSGEYYGFDILSKHINWCQKNIQTVMPNYRFQHLDIQNDRYNPNGKYKADAWVFDRLPKGFDFACLFSVFTHMYESEIANYLKQIHSVLSDEGRCFATFFLFDSDRLDNVSSPDLPLSMQHELNDHTRYHNSKDKLHAICFDVNFIKSMAIDTGFSVDTVNYGAWAGGSGSYQDYIVLSKAK